MNATRILNASSGASLWQGGWDDACVAAVTDTGFDVIVLCAKECQSLPVNHGREVLAVPFDDDKLTSEHWERAVLLARQVALRVRDGKTVLVTCRMGLNRSGLVVALACHMLAGFSGEEIVRRIQEKRGVIGMRALSNVSFADAIRRLK